MSRGQDRQEILKRVRDRIMQTDMGGAGVGYYKPKDGRNVVRIFPGVGEMEDFFWQDVGRHYMPTTNQTLVCPDFTIGEPCPICEFVKELYAAGDNASKELAQKISRRKQFWMNVADRDTDRAPLIYTPGVKVFRQVAGLVGDPDYGDLIYDEEEGLDLVIVRSGTGYRNITYDARPVRSVTPLHEDRAMMEQWLDEAADLTPVLLTDDPAEDDEMRRDEDGNVVAFVLVLPYERLKEKFEALDINAHESSTEQTDEGIRQTVRRRRARRTRTGR